jgi:isopenicillin N synthase-like dioxygenase
MSIACFFGPHEETIVAPLPKLIDDGNDPALYRATKFADYMQNFFSNRLMANRGTLDFARI